ncbi:HD domain-containing protein [Arundinibacter roseus]|uniref:HD domain-containing protein n=1 Tax=Arundinibacter roseus TaxID=2070510 RepID=A0A4R4K7Y6_9BACT|nr:HD domain-containing protein [Arundinibacter roseus]TDB62289.1 HD domain-containing protein [Arundinibacter roseus]
MKLVQAEIYILKELQKNLSSSLYYHSLAHVLDVSDSAIRIALSEGITDPHSLALLRTAALFHDAGFMVTYDGHEDQGCQIVHEILPAYEYSTHDIQAVCGMIQATKIPQTPKNHLEEIICDADLDYLGRDDFSIIADQLFLELKERAIVPNKETWDLIQVRFMENHRYWTVTSLTDRAPRKQQHLEKLRHSVQLQNKS